MRKKEILEHWEGLQPNLPLEPAQIAYKHEGSTYDEDGIRITGTPKFIDSVLSRLKELLEWESTETRLHVNYRESTDRVTKQPTGSYQCYIQVHERGDEAKHFNAMATRLAGKTVILSRGY
jgi:hypothetical protein